MGYQLWSSPATGYRRRGTTVAELTALFTDDITAASIFEPLKCCDVQAPANEVLPELERLDFDVVGLVEDEQVVGYLRRHELNGDAPCSEFMNRFRPGQIIAISTPLIDVFRYLADTEQVFVLSGNEVSGLVTRSDLQKPPVRILLFGFISLLEIHMTYWVRETYGEDGWIGCVKRERLEAAESLFEIRLEQNEEISVLDCLQFSDEKEIILANNEILEIFGISKKKGSQIFGRVERLRNKLAHSQVDIETGSKWTRIIPTFTALEAILERSDARIRGEA